MQKFIKPLLVAFACVAISFSASAQLRWGPSLAVNYSTLSFKQNLVTVDKVPGFEAGIQSEVIFPGIGFGVELGFLYNMLGAKVNLGEKLVWSSLGYGQERVYLHNIHIPVHLRFKWTRMSGLEDYVAPFVYGGPDVNFQIATGNTKAFKCSHGDIGLSVGFGLEILRSWQISAGYTWGMTYALRTKLLDNFSARNKYWSTRVTYFF